MVVLVTALLTAVFVVACLIAKDAITEWWLDRNQIGPSPTAQLDEIRSVVMTVCADVGLNREAISPDTDLLTAGKLTDVLQLSGRRLKRNVELRTVQDVVEWLAEAPAQE